MITQAYIEQNLRPSEAHALDLIRNAGSKGVNRTVKLSQMTE